MDCEKVCLNNGKLCHKCYNEEYLKLPKEKKIKKVSQSKKEMSSKDSWKGLEEAVVIGLNNVPSIKDARRSRGSGNLWFEKGDCVDDLIMPECKERIGNKDSTGAIKSFTIQRLWLEKAREEATMAQRIMMLPFRFKNDENIYTIFKLEDINELITMYKELRYENDLLRQMEDIDN